MKPPRLIVCGIAALVFLLATKSQSADPEKSAKPAADAMLGKEAGQVRDDNGLKMKLVWCPPGMFKMGSPDSENYRFITEDQVDVTLTKGYWLGQTEVTQGQWSELMRTTPWDGKEHVTVAADVAATFVNWHDAIAFCRELTKRERLSGRLSIGWEYTLPTDAQWECACRAGTTSSYSFGEDATHLGDYAWWGGLFGNGNAKDELYAHRGGQKKPNAWSLYDMHGNVSEWCRDRYEAELVGGTDPVGPDMGEGRVLRGGDWGISAGRCRSAARNGFKPTDRESGLGLRVALCQAGNK